MKNFVSVSTNAARYQDISLNPQKLAGMCAKLKCCLNYEVDNYVEASRKLPPKDAVLQTADGEFYQFKVDILAGLITYSSDKNLASNLETITVERAKEILEMNKAGEKPLSLMENGKAKPVAKSSDLLAEADLSRFDKNKRRKRNNNNRGRERDNRRPQNNAEAGPKPQMAEAGQKTQMVEGAQKPQSNNEGQKTQNGEGQRPQNGQRAHNGERRQKNGYRRQKNGNRRRDFNRKDDKKEE